MTMYDYVRLCMTMYKYVWLFMTMYDYICQRSEIVKLVQLWTNFVLVSWTCVGWFRMIQNGSKWLKKKFTVFKLCLRNLDFV